MRWIAEKHSRRLMIWKCGAKVKAGGTRCAFAPDIASERAWARDRPAGHPSALCNRALCDRAGALGNRHPFTRRCGGGFPDGVFTAPPEQHPALEIAGSKIRIALEHLVAHGGV